MQLKRLKKIWRCRVMNENLIISVVTALITGSITLIGTWMQNSKTIAVMETKMNMLTQSVDKHNKFAERIPVIEEQIKVANHRIEDLEKK